MSPSISPRGFLDKPELENYCYYIVAEIVKPLNINSSLIKYWCHS